MIKEHCIGLTAPELRGQSAAMLEAGYEPNFVYSYFNSKAVKTISGTPPLTFKSGGKPLRNYQIFGNTVNGASVGDLAVNYFDYNSWKNSITSVSAQGSITFNSDGTFTLAANENGDVFTQPYEGTNANTFRIAVEADTEYTFSFMSNNSVAGYVYVFENGIANIAHWHIARNATTKKVTFTTLSDTTYLTVRFGVANPNTSITYGDIMIIEGGTIPWTFLPYGDNYVIPVIVTDGETDAVIPDIILDSPLAKVGDTADYIDYRTQKRYNADGTSADVTLPEISTLNGTNTLTVGTEIQPSKITIEVKR